MTESYPILTILPPVVAIILVIVTKRVLLSLGTGVVLSALLVTDFDVLEAARLVWDAFAGIFWAEGEVNYFQVFILTFTILLGVIAAFIMMSGGTRAFADWAVERVKGRRGAQALAGILGVIIFIDDYFNALAVGQVSRPVTDRHRVSRAKLAYLIDSTSAPVAVLAPFSSWGAFIMGTIGTIVAASSLDASNLSAFLGAAAANYYAIAAVAMVGLVIVFRLDLFGMRREERRAIDQGETYDPEETIPGKLAEDLPVHQPGAMRALIVPFVVLVIGVLGGIIWTGHKSTGTWDLIDVLAETNTSEALMYGGVLGVIAAMGYYFRFTASNPKFAANTFGRGWVEGIRSMMPAVSILVLAWMLGTMIEELKTDAFLGDVVKDSGITEAWLIPLVFVVALAMAFATGTSWGSFGLLLPLAGGIINAIDAPELLLPTFGAVLAGAVAGDHASPISDTTILSATGAGCNVVTHTLTQLPYAMVAAGSALVGYVALALSGSTLVGLFVTLASLVGVVLGLRVIAPPLDTTAAEEASLAAS